MNSIRACFIAALFLAGCQQGQPDTPSMQDNRPLATILSENGLETAARALAGRPRTPETGFQLGAVRFLRAIETMMQVRYDTYDAAIPFIPGMMADLPPNPNAQFKPEFLETALAGALEHLSGAEAALAAATAGEFAADIPLETVWFDIDRNGQRAEWEALTTILRGMGAQVDWTSINGAIRFDTADAEWLAAYVSLVSGTAELVLSLEPTEAIRTIYEGRLQLERAGGIGAPDYMFGADQWVDQAAAVIMVLDGKPDAARSKRALEHYRKVIAHNRTFWTELMAETDNEREWLPNPRQTSPFGVEITNELATSWQGVLAEMEDMLEGRTLIPFWRAPQGPPGSNEGVGINLRKLLSDPGDMNVALMIQGSAFAPFMERGKLVSMEAWGRFTALTRGDGLLMAMILN